MQHILSFVLQQRDDLLRGITYFRVHDYQEQYEVILSLSSYIKTNPEVEIALQHIDPRVHISTNL